MIVQFNVRDFLDRAEVAYPERIGLIDEPDQPAEPWEPLTFAELAARARAQAVGLDRLGVGPGERVAVVSHNSSRLLTSFFGVCGWGRILVPVNFRLAPAEIEYIVGTLGGLGAPARPRGGGRPGRHRVQHRVRARCRQRRVAVPRSRGRAGPSAARRRRREQATATINYTSGTTARPKGVQLTHRNCWVNASLFGWHMRAVRPGRLPPHPAHVPRQRVGHAVGHDRHGLPPGGPAQGRRHRDPPTGGAPWGHACCARRRPWSTPCSTPPRRGTGPSPAATAPASWWPGPRRPAGPSSGSSPSWAGSSTRSTASPRRRRC